MIAIVIFLAATAASLLIGISAALRVMPLVVTRRSVRYVLLLSFVAVAMGLLSFGLMSTIETAIPANNSAQFNRQTSFGISQDEIAIRFELICISNPLGGPICNSVPKRTVINTILATLQFPLNVPIQKDFPVSLKLESQPMKVPAATYTATLFTPSYVEARSSQRCTEDDAKNSAIVRLCNTVPKPVTDFVFEWFATGLKTGRAIITVKADFMKGLPGQPEPNQKRISVRVDKDLQELKGGQARTDIQGVTVDIQRSEISFPVTVLTSLGVSQEMYDWMKVIGGLVAAAGTLFGAGFALLFFGKSKSRSVESQASETGVGDE